MDSTDDLVARIKARVADPRQARDAAAWVQPLREVPPRASVTEVDAAEATLGFPLPPLLRRLYTEVGNGGWGPVYGLARLPAEGTVPDEYDLVGFYLECVAPERALEAPEVEWPRGLVRLMELGCVSFEVCDFLRPPYPVFVLDGDTWDLERPVRESLLPIAPSLAERLEAWLAGPTDDPVSAEEGR